MNSNRTQQNPNNFLQRFTKTTVIFASLVLLFSTSCSAREKYTIQIKDHKFIPDVITVPSGVKLVLIIENLDPTVEEFESFSLNREKIVRGGKKIKIFLPALEPGEYNFFGEFHLETAQGKLVVK